MRKAQLHRGQGFRITDDFAHLLSNGSQKLRRYLKPILEDVSVKKRFTAIRAVVAEFDQDIDVIEDDMVDQSNSRMRLTHLKLERRSNAY